MREITVTTKVQLPRVPNFILLDGSKSDGAKLDVADLSDEVLRDLGAEWTHALLANAAARREVREVPK